MGRVTFAVIVAAVVIAAAVVGGVVVAGGWALRVPGLSKVLPDGRPDFPQTDPALSTQRMRILKVVRAQYQRNPAGTTYAQGTDEPWCADFVSWTLHTAGLSLRNPNSGSWRIPGVLTLTDYLRDTGHLRAPTHWPQPGDVVLYDKPSPLGQHTNIVVAVDGDRITTVGGNEKSGITLRSFGHDEEPGVQGYGVVAG